MMPVRIFTIPFNPDHEHFSDEDLSRFLLNKQVKKLHPEFFQIHDKAFWTVFVEYETIAETKETSSNGLNEAEKLLMKQLKEWRKETADKEGIPVFIIATNKQFMDVIRQAPKSLTALRVVHGFGKKKIERYGSEIVKIVAAFYEKKPLHPKNTEKLPDKMIKKDKPEDKKGP
jgi:superfamily II DNA helicase RecQ